MHYTSCEHSKSCVETHKAPFELIVTEDQLCQSLKDARPHVMSHHSFLLLPAFHLVVCIYTQEAIPKCSDSLN